MPIIMGLRLYIQIVYSNNKKPKDIELTFIYDKEKHKIITFENLELANVWHFCFKIIDYQNSLTSIFC